MNINITNAKLIVLSFFSFVAFALVGLITTNTPASAVVDTCTWTGGGNGVEDTGAMTWTFNVSDAANWNCSIDGIAAPESGDTLEFPANLADVDPGNTIDENDERQWKYIVNNDLASGTEFAGIQFTGDAGQDQSNDDGYQLTGNGIQLSGDVTLAYQARNGNPVINLDVEVLTDITLGATVESQATVTYGANVLTLHGENFPSFYGTLSGTGVLEIGQTNFNPQPTSSIGDSIVVLANRNIFVSISDSPFLNNENLTITVREGAEINFASYSSSVKEIVTNVVFEGNGANRSYQTSNAPGSNVEVNGYRGSFFGGQYNLGTQTNDRFRLQMSGDMTLSSNTIFSLSSDVEISGTINGNYSIALMPGSRGSLTISSSDNNSASPNGVTKPTRIKYALVDSEFDIWIDSGRDALLSDDEEITVKVTLQEGARLGGIGTVAGLEVQAGATVAPGESPGCIVSNGDLTLNGTYEFEILNNTACTGYDQLDVTGEVDVTGATLDLTLLPDYGFDEGDEFVLISNDGTDEVTGEFDGLAEGDEIEVDGNTFTISYEGGDGNDVSVLATAISSSNPGSDAGADADTEDAPGAPDTGIGSLLQNPLTTIIAAIFAGAMIVTLRKINSAK